MAYWDKQRLDKHKQNIDRKWRGTWLKAAEKLESTDVSRLVYVAESPERMAKLEETVALWSEYRGNTRRSQIGLSNIKPEDLAPLLDVHYYRLRLPNPDRPSNEIMSALNTVMRPKEVDDGGLRLRSGTTFGVEIECFGMNEKVGGTDKSPITRASLTTRLLKHLIPKNKFDWGSHIEHGVMRQGQMKGSGAWEFATPVLDKQSARYLNACVTLIEGMGAYVNSSCALHVHVGADDGKERKTRTHNPGEKPGGWWFESGLAKLGWNRDFTKFHSIQYAKQFLINYIMLEDELGFLDHRLVHRSEDVFRENGTDTDQAIKDIIKAKTFDELLKAQRPDVDTVDKKDWSKVSRQRLKVNAVRALLGTGGGTKQRPGQGPGGTIEVRHHPGTVSPRETIAWVGFIDELSKVSLEMVDRPFAGPHKPNTSEMKRLKGLVHDFVRTRGSKDIIDDAALPPERRAQENDDHTNIHRPVHLLGASEDRLLEGHAVPRGRERA